MIFEGLQNKLRIFFMFSICFSIVLLIPSLHRKCIITEPEPPINENKEIRDIQ
jgi:hypothetical protein